MSFAKLLRAHRTYHVVGEPEVTADGFARAFLAEHFEVTQAGLRVSVRVSGRAVRRNGSLGTQHRFHEYLLTVVPNAKLSPAPDWLRQALADAGEECA